MIPRFPAGNGTAGPSHKSGGTSAAASMGPFSRPHKAESRCQLGCMFSIGLTGGPVQYASHMLADLSCLWF